jgi:hypothetical protein
MTRSIVRSNLHSSLLIRNLVDLETAYLSPAPADLAQTLGQWISFVDASTLSALQLPQVVDASDVSTEGVSGPRLSMELARMRSDLEGVIFQSVRHGNVSTRLSLPVPEPKQSVDVASNYAPYRRYHQAHQQNMETKVRQLRVRLRDRLAKASPKLKQLAELDASLERILGEREASRLGNIPAFLEKRFKQLLQTHQQTMLDAQEADSVVLWLKPEGWLSRFHKELQAVLHAELDLRLQTTMGLIEAHDNEQTHNV